MKTRTHPKWVLGILLSAMAVLTLVTITISHDAESLAIATHVVYPTVVATLRAKDNLQSKKTTPAVTPSALPSATAALTASPLPPFANLQPALQHRGLNYHEAPLAISAPLLPVWYPSTGGLVPPNDSLTPTLSSKITVPIRSLTPRTILFPRSPWTWTLLRTL